MPPVEARGEIGQLQVELARRPVAGNEQSGIARFQNAVIEIEDSHFPGLIACDALDIIDANQRELLHALQHFRDKPGAFIERHITNRVSALRKLSAGGMQQMTAPTALPGPEIDVAAAVVAQHRLECG